MKRITRKQKKNGLSSYELEIKKKKFEERQHKEIKCYLFEGISVLSYFTIYCLT